MPPRDRPRRVLNSTFSACSALAAAAATTTKAMMGTMTNMEAAATVATANALISNEQTARALATTL